MHVSLHSQSFLLCDVKGGGHVDEGGEAVQVVTVGMRKDGVCLNKREVDGGRRRNAFSMRITINRMAFAKTPIF